MNKASTQIDLPADGLIDLVESLRQINVDAEKLNQNSKAMTDSNGEIIFF
jgi:hypothetical protein